MSEQTQDIDYSVLLQKYVSNVCTEPELRTLLHWLNSSDEDNQVFWSVSKSFWDGINSKETCPDDNQIASMESEVDSILRKIKLRRTKFHIRNWAMRAAAVALLVIGIGTGFMLGNKHAEIPLYYTELSAQQGEKISYILHDGTKVTLNSGSTLTFRSDFGTNGRHIEMNGEGFFDVAKDPDKPFIIGSGNAEIKVIGTSFNVKSYSEDGFMAVTVSTGIVEVNIPAFNLQTHLSQNEHIWVNKETGETARSRLSENHYAEWTKGLLYFDKEPIREVIKTINRKYDRNVILQCDDCHQLISGTHDNKSLEAVVETICFTTGLKSRTDEKDNIILY